MDKTYLFNDKINGKKDWSRVFQSITSFRKLINFIFNKHKLSLNSIENLTPGTNAVFKVGDYVIKIYAPQESGFYSDNDNELNSLMLYDEHIKKPSVIAHGLVKDKYDFKYIVMDYLSGSEARFVVKSYSITQKKDFVNKVNSLLNTINTNNNLSFSEKKFINDAISRDWNRLNPSLAEDIVDFLLGVKISESDLCQVHGDITGENLLVSNNDVAIIDFGDARVAPFYYEYPPILFELFDCDEFLGKEFLKNKKAEYVLTAILTHEFGVSFIEKIINKLMKTDINKVKSLESIKNFICKKYEI